MATCLVGETCGSSAFVKTGGRSRPSTTFWISATSASVRGSPSVRSNTIVAPASCCCGKASSMSEYALIDSYLSGRKSAWSVVESTLGAKSTRRTVTTIQAPMTYQGRREARRPREANTVPNSSDDRCPVASDFWLHRGALRERQGDRRRQVVAVGREAVQHGRRVVGGDPQERCRAVVPDLHHEEVRGVLPGPAGE